MKYGMVLGLETHVELSTKTKIFCGCKNDFGGAPNSHCCPICLGHPGTLPKLNKKVLEYAIMAGLATNCEINLTSKIDRKNYVYPDLPKAYQNSQFYSPICKNGYLTLTGGKKIRIKQIHIEEDAGKLIHKNDGLYIDYNRGGVPLIEIVTHPDFESTDEVREYIEKLQLIMRYIGVSNCKMEEGAFRCDVNISVKPLDSNVLGTRTEIKNMNSITFITKAINFEFERQSAILAGGGEVQQETLRFIEQTGKTESMRNKEDAHDYRYFADPDFAKIVKTSQEIEEIKSKIPELPDSKLERYINSGIPEKDALIIIKYKKVSDFFDNSCKMLKNPKIISNFIIGQIFSTLENESKKEEFNVKITPKNLNELAKFVEDGKINMNIAKKTLIKMLETGNSAVEIIPPENLVEITSQELENICKKVILENPKAVEDHKKNKPNAVKSLIGGVMKATSGRANAQESEKILLKIISES